MNASPVQLEGLLLPRLQRRKLLVQELQKLHRLDHVRSGEDEVLRAARAHLCRRKERSERGVRREGLDERGGGSGAAAGAGAARRQISFHPNSFSSWHLYRTVLSADARRKRVCLYVCTEALTCIMERMRSSSRVSSTTPTALVHRLRLSCSTSSDLPVFWYIRC
jgi:hypothetical protein